MNYDCGGRCDNSLFKLIKMKNCQTHMEPVEHAGKCKLKNAHILISYIRTIKWVGEVFMMHFWLNL